MGLNIAKLRPTQVDYARRRFSDFIFTRGLITRHLHLENLSRRKAGLDFLSAPILSSGLHLWRVMSRKIKRLAG